MDSSPDVNRLVDSNAVPTEAQIARIRELLDATEDNIEELQAQLNHQSEIKQLCQLILSPMRRIPDDILQEIFLLTVPTDLNQCHDIRGLLRLTAVCSRWRDIALSTARLWNRICVMGPRPRSRFRKPVWFSDPNLRRKYLGWTKAWITRSRKAPLYLYLDLGSFDEDLTVWKDVRSALKTFFKPIAPRLHHLTLLSSSLEHILPHSPFTDKTFRQLRSVIIETHDEIDPNDPARTKALTLFPACSQLHTVDVSNTGLSVERLSFPVENLAHFAMDCLDPDGVPKVMKRWNKLRTLSLSECGFSSFFPEEPSQESSSDNERIIMPNLESLSISFDEFSMDILVYHTLEAFDYPKLTALRLEIPTWFGPRIPEWSARKEITSLFSKLHELDLDKFPVDTVEHAKMLFEGCPQLRKLNMVAAGDLDFDEVMELLMGTKYLPHLEELELQTDSEVIWRADIHRLVCARVKPATSPPEPQLRRVRIYYYGVVQAYPADHTNYPVPPSVDISFKVTLPDRYAWRKTSWNGWRSTVGPRPEGMDVGDNAMYSDGVYMVRLGPDL
ncbi:hypothetical protein CC2G_002044 [Coprinopsis cinerea AmutBmut pab1-1]|nr:hypothetical protein CC2G_002044 [Coprinopsis cinerea AmutBmut pab1-1]